ncbi:MAG: biotin-dependent carboxyltransferase family protein [Desulfohalobiaceae bacterium]|nr:biotin-dependent carboxyltransferase family protein [Desulfohalobiaceae bacterium]
MTDLFLVVKPGSYTTIQDQGRYGHQDIGVPVAGALDQFASRAANVLLGNPESAAVLECTVVGPTLAVLREAYLAVTGADMEIRLNSRTIPPWSSFRVEPGDLLRLKQVKCGCRSYLAVSGGFDVPLVMGSRSTSVTGGFGGLQGRPLKKGDFLQAAAALLPHKTGTLPAELVSTAKQGDLLLRVIPGPQDHLFASQGLETFFSSAYAISPKADRMGYRLEGPMIRRDPEARESIVSEPSLPGNIQVPADGQPIILLVEQTVGGYTKIATVISADLPRIAQALPGQEVRFQPVSLEEAHEALQEQERHMQRLGDFLTESNN